jgi:uncharacterized membrane protein
MPTSLDSMQFYTKLLTGMILLLNIGLLVSIRMALKYAMHSRAVDPTEAGKKLWNTARRGLAVLIVLVVAMNAAAVYANHRMVTATRDIAAELPHNTDTEWALSMSR